MREAHSNPADSNPADSNPAVQRSATQGSYIEYNGMPILWRSGHGTVAMSHAKMAPGHADISVAASEIYALSETANRAMGLSYRAEEALLPFPLPATIQVDNMSAVVFQSARAPKSRLVHLDCRLTWVKQLRDGGVFNVVHTPTLQNKADIFTKTMTPQPFQRLRELIMRELPTGLRQKQVLYG